MCVIGSGVHYVIVVSHVFHLDVHLIAVTHQMMSGDEYKEKEAKQKEKEKKKEKEKLSKSKVGIQYG